MPVIDEMIQLPPVITSYSMLTSTLSQRCHATRNRHQVTRALWNNTVALDSRAKLSTASASSSPLLWLQAKIFRPRLFTANPGDTSARRWAAQPRYWGVLGLNILIVYPPRMTIYIFGFERMPLQPTLSNYDLDFSTLPSSKKSLRLWVLIIFLVLDLHCTFEFGSYVYLPIPNIPVPLGLASSILFVTALIHPTEQTPHHGFPLGPLVPASISSPEQSNHRPQHERAWWIPAVTNRHTQFSTDAVWLAGVEQGDSTEHKTTSQNKPAWNTTTKTNAEYTITAVPMQRRRLQWRQ